ncbi:MAG: DUF2059 domain-containing protein [Gammaproteobacteria bacterium]|nr:DUF2059 domain-containing protein [Gammaproteobacteria bacterium]MDH5802115.1 DUF2059 domain-containing protein [Gammaproteobacteria bacterium]
MLSRIMVLLGFCLCTVVISFAYASVYTTANELYLKSGIKTQIDAVPQSVYMGFQHSIRSQAHLDKLTPQEKSQYRNLINDAYNAIELKKIVMDYMSQNLNETEMMEALKWLKSPVGQKVTHLEERVVGQESSQEMIHYVQSLQTDPPPAEYHEFVGRLAQEIDAESTAVDIAMNAQLAITIAMATVEPKTTVEQLQYIQKELNHMRGLVAAIVSKEIVANLMFTYHTMPLPEFQQYVEFSSSTVGKKYQQTMAQALSKAINHGSLVLGEKMVQILQQRAKARSGLDL